MTFSTDRDLLIFEPRLFDELAWPGLTLAAGGDGELDGATFASASADFPAAGVQPGMVLSIQDAAGWRGWEIVQVGSAGELTVSALRADPRAEPIAPPDADGPLNWRIVSFAPQAQAVALEMITWFGLRPADPLSPWSADQIACPETLRTLSAYGVLATVLLGAAHRGDGEDIYWAKAVHYRGLFDRLMPKVRLGLDSGGDGQADAVRHLGAARMRRD